MTATLTALTPVSYHRALCDTLRELEPGLWNWFASDDFESRNADQIRLELLKSTYRMPPAVHPELHGLAHDVAQALGIDASLPLYQAQDEGAMNAGLFFVPGEIHIVFGGPVLKTLAELELKALLGHELAHYRLWTEQDGVFRVANELIEYMASQGGAPSSHVQSALRNRRWVELYADRGSLVATRDLRAAVGCLVKVGTGLTSADADSYIAQAEAGDSLFVANRCLLELHLGFGLDDEPTYHRDGSLRSRRSNTSSAGRPCDSPPRARAARRAISASHSSASWAVEAAGAMASTTTRPSSSESPEASPMIFWTAALAMT